MTRPIDSIIQSQRLTLINRVLETLNRISGSLAGVPLETLEEHKADLEELQAELLQFARLGDSLAHSLYVNISDAVMIIDYQIQKVEQIQPAFRELYTTNYHTLQWLAQRQYGAAEDWTRILPANGSMKYSTDLLDLNTVILP